MLMSVNQKEEMCGTPSEFYIVGVSVEMRSLRYCSQFM